jgi:hypothetical protein
MGSKPSNQTLNIQTFRMHRYIHGGSLVLRAGSARIAVDNRDRR